MSDYFIVPSPPASGGYVELAGDGPRTFRKHVLSEGELRYGGRVYTIDQAFLNTVQENFAARVCPVVQFPAVNDRNQHVEDPLRNLGRVTGLSVDNGKLYADIEVPDASVASKVGKTILDASAMLSLDYTDSKTGRKVGPTLLHVAATNRPHLTDLEPYRELVAMTATSYDEYGRPEGELVMLSYGDEGAEDCQEPASGALALADGTDPEDLLMALLSALSEVVTLSRGGGTVELTAETGAQAILELAAEVTESREKILSLTEANERLALSNERLSYQHADDVVQDYIDQGRLYAKSREKAVSVYLSEGEDGLEDWLAPANAPLIKMNAQRGIVGHGDGHQRHQEDIDGEILRYASIAEGISSRNRNRK